MSRSAWAHYHAFLFMIVAANVAIDLFGAATVGALVIPWGTFFAGATFVFRDLLHRAGGPLPALSAVVVGAAISYGFANPTLAFASGAAFLIAELADLAVFVRLIERFGLAAAMVASGVAGAVVDTAIFLPWSGIPMTIGLVVGQLAIKSLMSAIGAAVLLGLRTGRTRGNLLPGHAPS